MCRLQAQDGDTSSLEDLSDCSSDSMEVCCDDLGESHSLVVSPRSLYSTSIRVGLFNSGTKYTAA